MSKAICFIFIIAFAPAQSFASGEFATPAPPAPAATDDDLLKLAEGGDPQAQYLVGRMHHTGTENQPQNIEQAVSWYRKAAEQGHAQAQFDLGSCYLQGWGVVKDSAQALEWYLKAAAQNHLLAMFSVGSLYSNGIGTTQSPEQAANWYRKAAELGHAQSQYNLANRYFDGRGVEQNDRTGVAWMRKAADSGLAIAQHELGVCYANGQGVPRDFIESYVWFSRANSNGYAGAAGNRDIVAGLLSVEEKKSADRRLKELAAAKEPPGSTLPR